MLHSRFVFRQNMRFHSPRCSDPYWDPPSWARCSCDSAHARSIRWPTRGSSYDELASGSLRRSPIRPPTRISHVPCPCTSFSWKSLRNFPGEYSSTIRPRIDCSRRIVCLRVFSVNRPRPLSRHALDRWWSPYPSGRSRPKLHSVRKSRVFKVFRASINHINIKTVINLINL